MTLAWLLLGAALLLVPSVGDGDPDRGRRNGRRLPVVALAGVAAGCVALLGPAVGLAAAVVACPVVWTTLRRASRQAETKLVAADPSVPLVLDLTAAALRAGRPPADALAAAAPAASEAVRAAFDRVAGLLRLGADAEQAWSVLPRDGPLGPVAVVAVRSAVSGARLAVAFERLAGELRADTAAAAAARAQRAGVLALAPLGACFLPSFVLLGVVPVIVGMARTALGTAG